MNLTSIREILLSWIAANESQLLITAVVIGVYLILNFLISRLTRGIQHREFKRGAALKVIKTSRFVTGFFGFLVLMVVWGIDFGTVAIFATTTVTLLGVALFASWSLLSNITSYFVLLFHPSFARGTYIRVLDADNYVEGYISELTFFCVVLETEDKEVIVYPNNLLLSRVALVDPEKRLASVGKIVNPPVQTPVQTTSQTPDVKT